MKITFKDQVFTIKVFMYVTNGNTAIHLHDDQCRTAYVLTTNLETKLPTGKIYVKTWSENEEITNFLRNSEYFADTVVRVQCGYTTAEVWSMKFYHLYACASYDEAMHLACLDAYQTLCGWPILGKVRPGEMEKICLKCQNPY